MQEPWMRLLSPLLYITPFIWSYFMLLMYMLPSASIIWTSYRWIQGRFEFIVESKVMAVVKLLYFSLSLLFVMYASMSTTVLDNKL